MRKHEKSISMVSEIVHHSTFHAIMDVMEYIYELLDEDKFVF